MNLDRDIMLFLDDHRDPAVTTLARWAMDVGLSPFVLLACGIVGLVVAIAGRWWRLCLMVGGAAAAATVLTWVLKTIVARPRPPVDLSIVQTGGWSMPSTVAAITAAGAATFFLGAPWPTSPVRWIAGLALTAVVAAVGCAMVYLGAHWPSDVLAGWLLGLAIAAIAGRAGRDQPIGSSEVGATS